MRDKRSPGVDTSGWATILPGATPPPPAPAQQAPQPTQQPAQPTQQPAQPAQPGPLPAQPAYGPPPYGPPAYGNAPTMSSMAPNAVLNPPPAAFSPGIPNPAFPAIALPFAPPPKRTNPAIVIAAVVGGVMLVLIVIAVAIPVVLSQQKPTPVTLTIPASLDGSPQITTSDAQQATSMIVQGLNESEHGFASNFSAALYVGGTSPGVLVAAGKLTRRPSANERAQFFHGFEQGAAGGTNPVSFAPVPPGPLGGTTECGLETDGALPAVMCLSVDNSATVFIAVYTSDLIEGTTTALRVRGEVEHK